CFDPMTGFFRDGSCRTDKQDLGSHVICAQVTEEFLRFSWAQGNDLVTPRPQLGFPGLKAGDCWCVCALRWLEAEIAGCAPPIKLESTHQRALSFMSQELLMQYALDEI
ncbi:MAG: Unknown protein, partial [uncultured Thiotrichaceae bacterium]